MAQTLGIKLISELKPATRRLAKLRRAEYRKVNSIKGKMANDLMVAFEWAKTHEGFDYWYYIYNGKD